MLKVGLVGVGGISGAHIPAWDEMENAELIAICDIRTERMEKYPDKRHYTDFDEMLEKEQFDIIDICLPTYLHADFAVKAMEKGINVICEKPISLKEEDVERVYSTAKKNNVKFMVAQVLRFWPEYELLKEIYDTKRYGKLLSGTMIRLGGYPKWSKGYTTILFFSILLPLAPDDFFCYLSGLIDMSPRKFTAIILIAKPWCILFYSIFFAYFI